MAVITAVALLHGAAIYALITGLAVSYVKEITTVLTAGNIPVDHPTPPPEPPRAEKPARDRMIVAPIPQVPPLGTGPAIPTTPIGPSVEPKTFEQVTFDPAPPSPLPSFAPNVARARGNPSAWATTNDYPARDLREGNQGTTSFTLTIGTDGRVLNCAITRSSGFAGLDEATCRNVSRRARFEPATDASGNRVTGTYSNRIQWLIPAD